ncbi:hypothetical protein TNCV_1508551 [Trichonephila clavipes]|nr:hypothetical protein TNCV_1508551 [Trichonephila clavipes]
MNVCKSTLPSRLVGTLNSRLAASPLVRLVEEEKRWKDSDHPEEDCPIVSSKELVVVDSDNVCTAPIMAAKDILECVQSSKISLTQIPMTKMK